MAAYRIIFRDKGGEPVSESMTEHPDDDAAIDHAGGHSHPHEMHLWRGDRFVARVPPWSSEPR
jgi:hypothetical protein